MTAFPTRRPGELEDRPSRQDWLVDTLWGEQAVGILGGEPKCGKTFLALDIAVAVASAADVRFDDLDIAVIDTPVLRLDRKADRARLAATVSQARPRILILDPLVRLHGVDENAAGEIAPVLAFLRGLQRQFKTAVLVVHHARKSGAARAGQALRGSGELFAWCDSMVHVRRRRQQIFMSVEHRAAAARDDIELELATCEHGPALRVRQAAARAQAEPDGDPGTRIVQLLGDAARPLSQRQLRQRAGLRNETVSSTLRQLCGAGTVIRSRDGYCLGRAPALFPDDMASGRQA